LVLERRLKQGGLGILVEVNLQQLLVDELLPLLLLDDLSLLDRLGLLGLLEQVGVAHLVAVVLVFLLLEAQDTTALLLVLGLGAFQ